VPEDPVAHQLIGFDHVQLAMPAGQEGAARRFYVEVLGLTEQPKPPTLAARGGCWFTGTTVTLHLGVEEDFRPARKAHPALRVDGLDDLCAALHGAGHAVRFDAEVPGVRRCYVDDPFGNRIELIEN
jgi:catechol 2,3-dioxygenase-like lactoylglutathione lyase family enzyme